MSACTRNIIYVLASLCMVCEIRPLGGQMHTYSRLCEYLSTKATRQHSKLCQKREDNLKVVRTRRDVNITQNVNQSSTQTPIPISKRPLSSVYECKHEPSSPDGFSTNGEGLELKANCAKDGNWLSANISWEMPKPQPGRDDCTGYLVQWDNNLDQISGVYCDYIRDKNLTSYSIDSSKGWRRDKHGNDYLSIVVFPLPPNSPNSEITYRRFEPPICSGPTTQRTPEITLKSTVNTRRSNKTDPTTQRTQEMILKSTENTRRYNKTDPTRSQDLKTTSTSTKNITRPNNTATALVKKDKSGTASAGNDNNVPDRPVVNKLIFSIVIASIAILILAMIFALWKKRQIMNNRSDCKNYELNQKISLKGATHYISYNADNKNKAIKIASWLQEMKVNVVIDKFFVIKSHERAWSEQQLLAAEKIIMIITPRYLEICTLYQSKSNKGEKLGSFKDELVYNEISLMKNKMAEELATDKFMGILIDTSKKDLPHWMSQLKCFHYKNGKLDEEIFSLLEPCYV